MFQLLRPPPHPSPSHLSSPFYAHCMRREVLQVGHTNSYLPPPPSHAQGGAGRHHSGAV